MYTFLLILLIAGLGLLSHLARQKPKLERLLRFYILAVGLVEAMFLTNKILQGQWNIGLLAFTCLTTILLLFRPFRELLSWLLTILNLFISGRILLILLREKERAPEFLLQKKVFLPDSFPHLMAAFIYVTTCGYMLNNIYPNALKLYCQFPNSTSGFEHFFLFNGIALTLLSVCGIGIYVSRTGKQAIERLDLKNPGMVQIGIAIFLILASFAYDAIWAIYTHHLAGQDLATQLSGYNSGSFAMPEGFVFSVVLAMLAAMCAGIGEEVITRGALQPVFGILPTALLHGILHAHIAHAPIFTIKVMIWSAVMGIFRRYTNTTTVVIAHAGFNLTTILLFAANP